MCELGAISDGAECGVWGLAGASQGGLTSELPTPECLFEVPKEG